MREKLQNLLPSVLALAFVTLLAIPAVTAAQSGLPATISMYPDTAGSGATVEVTGLDFPGSTTVALQLSTPAGTAPLSTVVTTDGGSFRQLVTLPAGTPEGAWSLEAWAADGSNAAFDFEAGAPVEVAPVPSEVTVVEAEATGSSSVDIVVMLVMAVVLGAVATGALYAWRSIQGERSQPGMGAGDDLIWSGAAGDSDPELTATEEPFWKGPATATPTSHAAKEGSTAGTAEAPTSV